MTRDAKITFVLGWLLAGFVAAMLYHEAMSWAGAGYPYNTFLFRPDDRFNDLWNPMRLAPDPYARAIAIGNYFPLNYVALNGLRALGETWALGVFAGSFLCGFGVWCWAQLRGDNWLQSALRVAVLTGCSYPIWFSLDRANLEVWALGSAALWAHFYRLEKNHKTCRAANFALALTLNLKPFPIVFWALYIAHRRWRDLGFCALGSAAIFVFFMQLLPGGVPDNLRRLAGNLNLYNQVYIEHGEGMPFAHSLFGIVKMIAGSTTPGGPMAFDASALMKPYLALSLLAMLWLTIYLARVAQPWWAQLTLLVCAMNLLPFFSADYKLLHLFLPLFAWVNAPASTCRCVGDGERYDKVIAICFALLLMPKNIGHPWGDEISLASVFNPLLMLLLCATIVLKKPTPSSASTCTAIIDKTL